MGIEWEAFLTSSKIISIMADASERDELLDELKTLGVGKVYIEGFRNERTPLETLRAADNFFRDLGFKTATGFMMTGGGGGFGRINSGVERRGAFFCYSDPKLRANLALMCRELAGIFDEILIDDAFATVCTCDDCDSAMGPRDWGLFRRDLMLEVSRDLVIKPAREVNPGITINIKFPQYYDRLHLFGYDVERQTDLFDGVYIGVEVRNPDIFDYGWVVPYQAAFNALRARSFAGEKFRGGWFDDITCNSDQYAAQAEMAVRGGARRLVLFNWRKGLFKPGSPFRAAMLEKQPRLDDLARELDRKEEHGAVSVLSPPNADGGEDLFIFDYLGAWGFDLKVHTRSLPDSGPFIVTAHALGVKGINDRIKQWIRSGANVAFTFDALWRLRNDPEFITLAGLKNRGIEKMRVESDTLLAGGPVSNRDVGADPCVRPGRTHGCAPTINGREFVLPRKLRFAGDLDPETSTEVVVSARIKPCEGPSFPVPVVTCNPSPFGGKVIILNIRTFGHRDFPPEERLNVPIRVDLVDWPRELAAAVRSLVMGT